MNVIPIAELQRGRYEHRANHARGHQPRHGMRAWNQDRGGPQPKRHSGQGEQWADEQDDQAGGGKSKTESPEATTISPAEPNARPTRPAPARINSGSPPGRTM